MDTLSTATEAVVAVAAGRVRGVRRNGIAAFKGIPFAAPPFGARRMRPPAPCAPWEGVRDALEYGPTVPKPGYFPPFDELLPEPAVPGEDCLNLNVWTPDPGTAGLPVMVWVHGGAFSNGSGAVPTYDGAAFARDGAVLVTINYRLGADGFLYTGDGVANIGLLDQIAALEWVRDNIAAFGGDPGRVTVFGESAGGMSVGALLAMPRARGLFRQAIAQSGAGHHAISTATARLVAGHLAEILGVGPGREAVAAVPIDRLTAAQVQLSAGVFANPDPARWGEVALNAMPFEPVIDGEVLPSLPIEAIRTGSAAGVSVLVGSNADEQNLFLVPTGVIGGVGEAMLAMAAAGYGLPAGGLDVYRAARPGANPGELLAAVGTDWFYRVPAIRLAEAQAARGTGAHMYQFAWRSPLLGGALGACHALEIPFVFDNLGQEGMASLVGEGAPAALAAEMHAAWVRFAATGDPGWPAYETGRRATMRYSAGGGEVVDDPAAAERELWEGRR